MAKIKSNSIFQINPEYYTFTSGALISIPLSMLFEIKDYYTEITFWLGLILSIFTSFFCFKLSILLKDIHETYESNRKGVGDAVSAWNAAIKEEKGRCVKFIVLTFLTLILSIACVCIMQFMSMTYTTFSETDSRETVITNQID